VPYFIVLFRGKLAILLECTCLPVCLWIAQSWKMCGPSLKPPKAVFENSIPWIHAPPCLVISYRFSDTKRPPAFCYCVLPFFPISYVNEDSRRFHLGFFCLCCGFFLFSGWRWVLGSGLSALQPLFAARGVLRFFPSRSQYFTAHFLSIILLGPTARDPASVLSLQSGSHPFLPPSCFVFCGRVLGCNFCCWPPRSFADNILR